MAAKPSFPLTSGAFLGYPLSQLTPPLDCNRHQDKGLFRKVFLKGGQEATLKFEVAGSTRVFVQLGKADTDVKIGAENLPFELINIKTKGGLQAYLSGAFLRLVQFAPNCFQLFAHQRGMGGVRPPDLDPYIILEDRNEDIPYFCYILKDQSDASIKQAADRIAALLQEVDGCPRRYFATFETDPNVLLSSLEKNAYLVVNGKAVSITNSPRAPNSAPSDVKDTYFSDTLLEEPVRCKEAHWLERRRAEVWAQANEGNCPEGDHSIGDLKISTRQVDAVRRFKESQEATRTREAEFVRLIKESREESRTREARLAEFVSLKASYDLAKIPRNVDVNVVWTREEKTTTAIRMIPVAGFFLGLFRAGVQWCRGEFKQGCRELAAGTISLIPILGTYVSYEMGKAIIAVDRGSFVKNGEEFVSEERVRQFELDVQAAFRFIFGKNEEEIEELTKEEVDRNYKKTALQLHPDREEVLGDEQKKRLEETMKILNAARDVIYKHKGFQQEKRGNIFDFSSFYSRYFNFEQRSKQLE